MLAEHTRYRDELMALTLADGVDRAALIKEANEQIKATERDLFTARKEIAAEEQKLVEEQIAGEDTAADRREKAAERNVRYAETEADKYAALAVKRRLIEERFQQEVEQLRKQYWLTEEARLEAENKLYDQHKDDILAINKQMYDTLISLAKDANDKWLAEEKSKLDEIQKAEEKSQEDRHAKEKRALEKRREDTKKAYDKQLQDVRDFYDAIDKEISRRKRSEELSELRAEADKYAGSATFEGQEHYRSLLDQIAALEEEQAREVRTEQQQAQEAAITAQAEAEDAAYATQLEAMDAAHKKQKEKLAAIHESQKTALQQQYDEFTTKAQQIASDTVTLLTNANGELVTGTAELFETFGQNIDAFAAMIAKKIEGMYTDIQASIPKFNVNFGTSSNMGASSTITHSNTDNSSRQNVSMTMNDYGAKSFNTPKDYFDTAWDNLLRNPVSLAMSVLRV
jgi:hypothetical protein